VLRYFKHAQASGPPYSDGDHERVADFLGCRLGRVTSW